MGVYKVSKKAKEDLANAYEYGIETFGLSQAQMYLLVLDARFKMLANNVNLGCVAAGFYQED